jgi:putative peptidoglycan lipid II flippase
MVISREMIVLLFQRGRFDTQATLVTAAILPFFMIGAFGFSAQTIVSRGYYALQNTLFPALFSSLCVGLSFPLIYFLMTLMGPRGIALGLSLSVVLQAFVLYECWSRKSRNTGKKEVYLFFLKIILVSLFMGVLLFLSVFALRQAVDSMTFYGALMIAGISGIECIILFFLAGKILKINEILVLYEKIFKRVFPWMKRLP